MKIRFSQDDMNEIDSIIKGYRLLDDEMSSYQNELNGIKDKISNCKSRYGELKEKENSLMESLHLKYGDFTLEDIRQMLYDWK